MYKNVANFFKNLTAYQNIARFPQETVRVISEAV